MEFEAVIMAAGRGSRMTDLTAKTPKPLLPIGNKPMIWYPVSMLERAGFEEALVVVYKSSLATIRRSLDEVNDLSIRLEYVTIPDNEDFGTADSLRYIKDRLKADLLVVSCDLITDLPLHLIADVHRTHDAGFTMLAAPAPSLADASVPGGKANRHIERDLIGLDESGRNVLFIAAESDIDENISLRISDLRRHPYVNIHTDLIDAHLYLMKRSVIDILANDRSINSIKGELLPLLVKQQMRGGVIDKPSANETTNTLQSLDDFKTPDCGDKGDSTMRLAYEMSTWTDNSHCSSQSRHSILNQSEHPIHSASQSEHPIHTTSQSQHPIHSASQSDHSDVVRCCAYVMKKDLGMCLRTNTLVTYCEANRQIARQKSLAAQESQRAGQPGAARTLQVGTESLVGEGVSLGERVSVKWSVIGSHCNVGGGAKIMNCVVMDHVTIDSGASLSGCVVCENASIAEKAELKDCLVGSGQSVPTGKFMNEVMVDVDEMMEI